MLQWSVTVECPHISNFVVFFCRLSFFFNFGTPFEDETQKQRNAILAFCCFFPTLSKKRQSENHKMLLFWTSSYACRRSLGVRGGSPLQCCTNLFRALSSNSNKIIIRCMHKYHPWLVPSRLCTECYYYFHHYYYHDISSSAIPSLRNYHRPCRGGIMCND